MQNTINFHAAVEIVQQNVVQDKRKQQEAINEFLESTCDMFSGSDWFYYVEETGKSLEWLRANAKYSDPQEEQGTMLNNAIMDGDYELMEFYI